MPDPLDSLALGAERERQLRARTRALLLPLLPVDLDLLISDAATTSHWAGSRWHGLGHIHREGVPLDAPEEDARAILRLAMRHEQSLAASPAEPVGISSGRGCILPLGTPVARGSQYAAKTGSATELPAGLLKRSSNSNDSRRLRELETPDITAANGHAIGQSAKRPPGTGGEPGIKF